MKLKRPLGDERLVVLETISFLDGEADEVRSALARIDPGVIALDLPPSKVHEVSAHVKHGTGIKVDRLAEVWTNCLSAFTQAAPYAEHAAAIAHARDLDLPVVGLDTAGFDLGRRKQRRIEGDLEDDPIRTVDPRELAMTFRGRLHDAGALSKLEQSEATMADELWDILRGGDPVAALLAYPGSEEIVVRVRALAETEPPEAG